MSVAASCPVSIVASTITSHPVQQRPREATAQ